MAKQRKVAGTYDPFANALMEEGVYPAHIVEFAERPVNTKLGDAFVYDLQYKIAPEASKQQQTLWKRGSDGYFARDEEGERIPETDSDGKPLKMSCGHFAGRKLYANGIFLFTDDSGSGRNRTYFGLLEIAGVEPKEVEVRKGIKVKQLIRLEKEDLLGKPVLVKVGYRSFVTRETRELPKEDQDVRWAARVLEVYTWKDGKPLSTEELEEEELPF